MLNLCEKIIMEYLCHFYKRLPDKLYNNIDKRSGEIVSVYLKDYGITINDYLWRESDCEECFRISNMLILDKLKPTGFSSDGKDWVDEYIKAPFVIYIISK